MHISLWPGHRSSFLGLTGLDGAGDTFTYTSSGHQKKTQVKSVVGERFSSSSRVRGVSLQERLQCPGTARHSMARPGPARHTAWLLFTAKSTASRDTRVLYNFGALPNTVTTHIPAARPTVTWSPSPNSSDALQPHPFYLEWEKKTRGHSEANPHPRAPPTFEPGLPFPSALILQCALSGGAIKALLPLPPLPFDPSASTTAG